MRNLYFPECVSYIDEEHISGVILHDLHTEKDVSEVLHVQQVIKARSILRKIAEYRERGVPEHLLRTTSESDIAIPSVI